MKIRKEEIMKQEFNVGVAVKYGVEAAIIVSLMMDFCKREANCKDPVITKRENGKLFISRSLIYEVAAFMPANRFKIGISNLLSHRIIETSEDRASYAFTDYAKIIFSKAPIRITITWQ